MAKGTREVSGFSTSDPADFERNPTLSTELATGRRGRVILSDNIAEAAEVGSKAIWGDNVSRKGYGGAAKDGRKLFPEWGIATKRAPSMNEGSFFEAGNEADRAAMVADIDRVLAMAETELAAGRDVYVQREIGAGLSQLKSRAPELFEILGKRLREFYVSNRTTESGQKVSESPGKITTKRAQGSTPGAEVTPENTKISAPSGAARVAKILNQFADIRAATVDRNRKFTNMKTRAGKKDVVLSQIDRAIGTMGVFGMFHDRKAELPGEGLIQEKIADLAGKLGVDATDEFETGRFLANKKLVAEVFRDMLLAIRHMNQNPDMLDQASRDNLSAMVIEMSRILHDYADPRSRAIFQKMNKRVSYSNNKSQARFGLTADAAEIAAQGVEMPANAPEGEKARLQRVAAAQVGQVPQASIGDEPSVTRNLDAELGRGGARNVSDFQRYVDEVGLFDTGDTASIDIKGMVKFTGPTPAKNVDMDRVERGYSIALGEFLDSPLGFLADRTLDLNRFFRETSYGSLKLKKLERRGDFGTPIAVRTNKKYRSGVAPSERVSGLTPNAEQIDADVEMQMIVDAADRATQISSGRLVKLIIPEAGITVKIPKEAQQIMRDRLAKWEANRNNLAARMGDKDADAYLATEEGILQFGEKPEVLTEINIDGRANTQVFTDDGTPAAKTLVMPESVAAQLVAENPDLATQVTKLGDSYQIRFNAVVSPQYIVLKNGTVVSARSSEEGVITHRKVYPVRVRRVGPNITRTERGIKVRNPKNMAIEIEQFSPDRFSAEGGTDFESADQVSESRDQVRTALRRFQETFGPDGPGFNSPESPALFDQVVEIIRTDAYSALEILAINGDVFPQLEAELISSITELGDFRVDRVPTYFKARKGAIESVEQSGLGTVKGRVLTGAEARRLAMDPLVRNNLKTGDVKDILWNPERFGVTSDSTISSDVDMSQSIIRGLMLLKKMSMIAGVQIGYGGLRAADLRHATKRGPIELIRRDPFWMLADKDVYERAAKASGVAEAASRAFSGLALDIENISTEAGRAALQAMLEADEAAMLAARAAVEVARGVLGRDWSIELDPQYQRTRFPENPDPTRRAADVQYYRYARLMDSIEGKVVELKPMTGGALAGMRSSGALSAKADKFFADLQRAGIQIQATETSPEGLTTTERGGRTLSWDPEFGWILDPLPEVTGRVARGTTRFLLSSLAQKDQDALIVEMVNKIRETFVPTPYGAEPLTRDVSLLERTGGIGEFPRFRTIEEVRRVADPEEVKRLFDPVVKTTVEGRTKTETRKSGRTRTVEIPLQSDQAVRDIVLRLGEAVSNPTRRTPVPQGYIKIVKADGTEEVAEVGEFLRRRKERKVEVTEYDDLDGIIDEEDLSWSADEQQGEGDTFEGAPTERKTGITRTARQFAVRLAVELQKRGATSAQETIESVLSEFKGELGDINNVKSLNSFFTKFWEQFTDVTLGKNVYTKARVLVRAMGKNIWVEKGIALLNQGPTGEPALGITTRPANEDKSGKTTYGPEETIVVTKKGKRLINADVALPVLQELRPIFMDADLKVARPMYEFFAKFLGVKTEMVGDEVKIPRLAHGPATKVIDVSIRQITEGKVPEFDADLVEEDSVQRVSMNEQGQVQAAPLSATGRPKKTAAETGDVSFDDLGGDLYEQDYDMGTPGDVDPEMNYAVRQGKLLGLLQPDRLLPKMGPRVRSIDASIRTPVGGTVAGAAIDFATLGIGGNLTPENALFTGALNATSLLSKSPLKSTAIGAAASLGATALTGGDIGRTLFNLVGSVGGGIIGGVASGGLGSLGGSVAGGFAADELWKALFNQDAGWGIRRSAPTPDLNVRLP
jgi:hypothetical protein